jgi:DNA-binding GntR family transcriptional regulator
MHPAERDNPVIMDSKVQGRVGLAEASFDADQAGPTWPERPSRRIAIPTLHERIVDTLRDMIVEADLEPGSRLPEQELCEQLGISRTPLREAIKVLAFEGLVTLMANRGAVVTTPDMPEVVDSLEMIGMLEGVAAMLCAQRASDEELRALEKVHEDLAAYSRAEALPEYFRANIQLHRLIVDGAHNRVLVDLHVKLGSQLKRARQAQVSRSSRAQREAFIAEHQAIIGALMRRDGLGAFQAAVAHMASVVRIADPNEVRL